MKVSTLQPFTIIYSIFEHEFLGFIFEPFVVQINSKGELTNQYQRVSPENINEFAEKLDEVDIKIVKWADEIRQDVVLKKHNPKKYSAFDFFSKVFDSEKGDKSLKESILQYMDHRRAAILEHLADKPLFVMGKDNPLWKRINRVSVGAKVYFNFIRNDENTHYFPSIKCGGDRVHFQFKDAYILCDNPAWLLIEDKLYHFEKHVDGKKLRPFLQKNHIIIPKKIEETYYKNFVAPLVAQFDVFAQGFEIRYERSDVKSFLRISEYVSATSSLSLYDSERNSGTLDESTIKFTLTFCYGNEYFDFSAFTGEANVKLEKTEDSWIFHKVKRDLKFEKKQHGFLKEIGLNLKTGVCVLPKRQAFAWLQKNRNALDDGQFTIEQVAKSPDEKLYFSGYSFIDVQIEEANDWFDIKAKVRFGEFEIPFLKLKNLIMANKREFTLPNGQVAVIPEEWFVKYSELFGFLHQIDSETHILKKHHLMLVHDLTNEGYAHSVLSRKLERLRDFEKIATYEAPKGLQASLRPYQKAGYDWLNFLSEYQFGACLADDMGLGKTIQTLAFLQAQKESGKAEHPSLLLMPTSLIYNWLKEIEKFTPELKAFVYAGSNREKNTQQFDSYDLILTSYGILRLDIDLIKNYRFHYVILDESQTIKNPSSIISKAVMQLNAANRLILTGTPLENSTMDLWSQMTFINPGLLGTQNFFKNEFQLPIEKQQDEQKIQRLYRLIKPFMLRRHKSQVATEAAS